jgi:PEP-CTERM motif
MNSGKLFAAATLLLLTTGAADATTIDFTTYPLNTPITTVDGVTFTLYGGPGPGGTAVTGSFGNPALGNSPDGEYPTSQGIAITFSTPVDDVSFVFSNYGDNDDFGPSVELAFAGATQTDFQDIGNCNGCTVSVVGNDITTLYLDNGSDSVYSWEFGLYQLDFTSAVPEPLTLSLFGAGLLGAAGMRRRRKANKAA